MKRMAKTIATAPTTTRAAIGASKDQADDPTITELRVRARRNMLASLFLAQGVPLLLAGDEVSNSQNGNNNTYCQDNEIGWVDWSGRGEPRRDQIRVRRGIDGIASTISAASGQRIGSTGTAITARRIFSGSRHRRPK